MPGIRRRDVVAVIGGAAVGRSRRRRSSPIGHGASACL